MRFWPRSLHGQMLLALALALLIAQAIGAALLYRAQAERRDFEVIATSAFRLARGIRPPGPPQDELGRPGGRSRVQVAESFPAGRSEARDERAEEALAAMLAGEGVRFTDVAVVHRELERDRVAMEIAARWRERMSHPDRPPPEEVVLAGLRQPDGQWRYTRVFVHGGDPWVLGTLLAQTLFIYIVLVGVMWLLLRRITRPLAALTARVERFAAARDPSAQLAPTGPEDVRRLIAAHNEMEGNIAALLDEKDVMLGAIGHDLKTPLAALRVRIENVEDDVERARLAAGIEDINRSLDDILSLARVGRPSDPLEPTELSALVAQLAEEYEDLGAPVEVAASERIVLPLRSTWLRRALRNLIDNALRYGEQARVTVQREDGYAVIHVDDEGPGIPEAEIARMLEPFTRLEASRSSVTGGAGLGLTLARAIAEQHGGSLRLENRREGERNAGLTATLRVPT